MKKSIMERDWELNEQTYVEMIQYLYKGRRTVLSATFNKQDGRMHVEFNPFNNGKPRITKFRLSAIKNWFFRRVVLVDHDYPLKATRKALLDKLIQP